MYADAKQRHREAAAEDRRYGDYLLHKYGPQPVEFQMREV
jgi:hypothetical protein